MSYSAAALEIHEMNKPKRSLKHLGIELHAAAPISFAAMFLHRYCK